MSDAPSDTRAPTLVEQPRPDCDEACMHVCAGYAQPEIERQAARITDLEARLQASERSEREARDRCEAAEQKRDEARRQERLCRYDGNLEIRFRKHAEAHVAGLTERVGALEAGLRPFAMWIDKLDVEFADHTDDIIAGGVDEAVVTFGDLRRARALLDGTGAPETGGRTDE